MPAVVETSVAALGTPQYQPFQCSVCLKRFTRHENLKRHASLHSSGQAASLSCEICGATFARADLRRRHMRNKHPDEQSRTSPGHQAPAQRQRTRSPRGSSQEDELRMGLLPAVPENGLGADAQDLAAWGLAFLQGGVVPSESEWSTARSQDSQSRPEVYDYTLTAQAPAEHHDLRIAPGEGDRTGQSRESGPDWRPGGELMGLSRGTLEDTSPWQLTDHERTVGVDLYFKHVSPYIPFLHGPTFDLDAAPDHLVLGMCSLAFFYAGGLPNMEAMPSRCYSAASKLVSRAQSTAQASADKLEIIQTHLLLQLCAMFHLDGRETDNLRSHSKVINLARANGLMQPLPARAAETSNLGALWRESIKAESHKRTILALHHMDALWYQLLSVPRSISHLEIKHDLPCSDLIWKARSAEDWALRRLTTDGAAAPSRYADAIRLLLNAESGETPRPRLGYQGTLNVVHFLLSSIREISGWSAMTGRVSLERYEALISSLKAIEPSAELGDGLEWTLVEATWRYAMLETLSWSTSHMGGIVESSLAGALATASCLAGTQDCTIEAPLIDDLRPHLDWFLSYLGSTVDADSESPLIAVYALKAFLLAWQLARTSAPDVFAVVGIAAGDQQAALAWALHVFGRRSRWKVGRLVCQNLQALGDSRQT